MGVYLADVEVSFGASHPQHGKLKGAFVWCFVPARGRKAAEAALARALAEDGMVVETIKSVQLFDFEAPPDWGDQQTQLDYERCAQEANRDGDVVYAQFYGYREDDE